MSRRTNAVGILRGSILALLAITFNVAAVLGDERVSPDGVIVVTAPHAVDFQQVDDPPEPFIALWMSNDETLRLGVTKTAIPSHIKLARSATEEGLAGEVGGTITASSSVVKNGHEIWIMTAKGTTQGMNIQITQAIAQYNGNVYKVMAAAVGDGPIDETTMDAFVNSADIKATNSNRDTAHVRSDDQRPNDPIDLHHLSKRVGGAGALLLIGIILWIWMRRAKNRP